jgi:hypothetical protein
MTDAEAYAAPTPRVFYIHDDLSDYVCRRQGVASLAFQLTRELFALVRRDPRRVVVLTLEWQIERLLAHGPHAPFTLALGIGRAGERVAQQLHARTGWFPRISRVDVTREEDGRGGYRVVSTSGIPLAQQLPTLDAASSLAVVDDTVFSGLTMRTVLQALPPEVRARTQAFCLRGVAASLAGIVALCPVASGFAAPGSLHSTSGSAAASLFRAPHVDARLVPRLRRRGHRLVPALECSSGAGRPPGSVPLRGRRYSAGSGQTR